VNQIRKLAGQTAVYGIPSILGRVLNYMLVPIYTRVFEQDEYGIVTLMYSFVAVVFIMLTYGMETAFFRYSELSEKRNKVFNNAMLSLLFTTSLFIFFILFFPAQIAEWIKYPDYGNFVIWIGLIIGMDVLTAIPFAKLRADNRAKRFAFIKLLNIIANVGLNLFFIKLCPAVIRNYDSGIFYDFIKLVFDPGIPLISYVFISNLIASALTLVLMLPVFMRMRLDFDLKLWKQMMTYGLPLLFAGLAAVMNETLGRILIRYLLPEDIAEAQLGIYAACYKIAILMSLFIQAFRYAAEPFFFSYAKHQDSREVYALIMKYFVIAISIIFLGLMLFLDIVILLIGKDFRSGIDVVPVLLLAYMFLGIYYNLSVWFKLTNRTRYGAYMAIFGAALTIVFNLILIPESGYMGSAWATFICYASMMLLSFILMQKFFTVKYNYFKITFYMALSFGFYMLSKAISIEIAWVGWIWKTTLFFGFIAFIYLIERRNLNELGG